MNIKNRWSSMTFEDGRWTLEIHNALRIADALVAVKYSDGKITTSKDWEVVSKKIKHQSDSFGKYKQISIVFTDVSHHLRIKWNVFLYEKVPVTAFSIAVKNEGKEDKLIKYLAPIYALASSGSIVSFSCGPAEEFVAIPNNLWMSNNTHLEELDGRKLTESWWCSFLGHKPTNSGIVVGIGDRANTQTRISFNSRGPFLEMEVAGEMDVNRHKKPFRLMPGKQFQMNRCILTFDENIHKAIERYTDCLRDYAKVKLHFPPYTGIFSAYGQDPEGRSNWIEFPLTTKRVKDLMTILENHISHYGIDYIKTQFGGGSSGPGTMILHRREWTSKPIFPETDGSLPELIYEKGFTPDTFDLKKYHPEGVGALSDEVHSRGFKHALVCRPFLNVEGGTAERDQIAARIFRMAVKKWGYDYLMFDFVCCDYENDENDTITMAEGIRNRFQAVRDAVGRDIFIEACMMQWGPVIGIADGFRPIGDWRGATEPEMADAFASRYFLHGKLFQLDLEFFHPAIKPFIWETFKPVFASLDRVKSWVAFSALSGCSYLTGGVIEEVSDERWHLFTRAMPIYGKVAIPVDILCSKSPKIWKLEAESGGYAYSVFGLFNWKISNSDTIRVDFKECGFIPGKKYILFDFWAGRMLGIFSDEYSVTLSPGACQVLFVHELTDIPRIIGTDRHVTGAIGLKQIKVSSDAIDGTSEGPPGTQIIHYVYVPGGRGPSKASNCKCEIEQLCVLRVKVKFDGFRSKARRIANKRWKIELDSEIITV